MYPSHSTIIPVSNGPLIDGTEIMTDRLLTNPIAHMFVSMNTLQHFRADASRKSSKESQGDFQIEPRFSQTLYPIGYSGTDFHRELDSTD